MATPFVIKGTEEGLGWARADGIGGGRGLMDLINSRAAVPLPEKVGQARFNNPFQALRR